MRNGAGVRMAWGMAAGRRRCARVVWLATAAVLFAAAAAAQTGAIEITDAWARATPGGASIGAAYITLRSANADRLTGVATPVAGEAQLHQMTMAGGIAKMRPMAALDLPAGQNVTLQPGGVHIMLIGLKAPLKPGEHFPLTLHFAKAGTREITVAVGKIGAMGPMNGATQGAAGGTPMPGRH